MKPAKHVHFNDESKKLLATNDCDVEEGANEKASSKIPWLFLTLCNACMLCISGVLFLKYGYGQPNDATCSRQLSTFCALAAMHLDSTGSMTDLTTISMQLRRYQQSNTTPKNSRMGSTSKTNIEACLRQRGMRHGLLSGKVHHL